jgi:hypothetical protein
MCCIRSPSGCCVRHRQCAASAPQAGLCASSSRAMVIHITFRAQKGQSKGPSGGRQPTMCGGFGDVDERAICRLQIDVGRSGLDGKHGPAQSRDDVGLRAPMASASCPRLLASTAAFVARFQAGLRVPAAAGCSRIYSRQLTGNESFTWRLLSGDTVLWAVDTQPKPSLQVTALRGVDAHALRRTPNYEITNRCHECLTGHTGNFVETPDRACWTPVWFGTIPLISRTPGEL